MEFIVETSEHLFFNQFTSGQAIISLRCNELLRVKKNERTLETEILNRKQGIKLFCCSRRGRCVNCIEYYTYAGFKFTWKCIRLIDLLSYCHINNDIHLSYDIGNFNFLVSLYSSESFEGNLSTKYLRQFAVWKGIVCQKKLQSKYSIFTWVEPRNFPFWHLWEIHNSLPTFKQVNFHQVSLYLIPVKVSFSLDFQTWWNMSFSFLFSLSQLRKYKI